MSTRTSLAQCFPPTQTSASASLLNRMNLLSVRFLFSQCVYRVFVVVLLFPLFCGQCRQGLQTDTYHIQHGILKLIT